MTLFEATAVVAVGIVVVVVVVVIVFVEKIVWFKNNKRSWVKKFGTKKIWSPKNFGYNNFR